MKKTNLLLTILFLLPSICLFAQIIPNSYFNDLETITCPYDTSVTITQPEHWRIYQTLNDKWDGPVDSSVCINVVEISSANNSIDLGTIDPNKAVFIRGLQEFTPNYNLVPDFIYSAIANIDPPSGISLKTTTDCPNNICSGLIVAIEIPDSNFTGTTLRYHYDIPDNVWSPGDFNTCVATEYFDHNYLSEFVIKLTLDNPPQDLNDKFLRLYNGILTDWSFVVPVMGPMEAQHYSNTDDSYFMYIYELGGSAWWDLNYLFTYGDHSTYPSSSNIYYIEGRPEPNTLTAHEVNLIVDDGFAVVFQPFTAIRGALVEGSDSLRHTLNLISNGSDVCIEGIIDFTFDEGSKLIFNGGHLNFEGRSACLMFKNKGALVVGENQTLYYGQNGKGILALQPGGEIILKENSQLIIDNTLWLQGVASEKYAGQFYLDLQPGNSISFGDHAQILNLFSQDNSTKLNVYMNGGILDDSKLSPASRSLINRIYPEPKQEWSDNIEILGNPVSAQLEFNYISNSDEFIRVDIFDLNGRVQVSEKVETRRGLNKEAVQVSELANGVYAVRFSSGEQQVTFKILKF